MTKILIVEDDEALCESLRQYLEGEGFQLLVAGDGASAREQMAHGPELVILDWMLPDEAGIDLLRQWREQGVGLPFVMLTARTELIDRVLGLELGANDYVTKPFEPRELLARIRVQLRGRQPQSERLSCAEITMDLLTRAVTFRGKPVLLTRQEFALLQLLVENPNRVFSREEILSQVWGYEHLPSTRTVDTHMLQLRQKLDAALFETIRGIGYRLRG